MEHKWEYVSAGWFRVTCPLVGVVVRVYALFPDGTPVESMRCLACGDKYPLPLVEHTHPDMSIRPGLATNCCDDFWRQA